MKLAPYGHPYGLCVGYKCGYLTPPKPVRRQDASLKLR